MSNFGDCSICHAKMTNPKALPCGHCFCGDVAGSQCFPKLIEVTGSHWTTKCPVCHDEVSYCSNVQFGKVGILEEALAKTDVKVDIPKCAAHGEPLEFQCPGCHETTTGSVDVTEKNLCQVCVLNDHFIGHNYRAIVPSAYMREAMLRKKLDLFDVEAVNKVRSNIEEYRRLKVFIDKVSASQRYIYSPDDSVIENISLLVEHDELLKEKVKEIRMFRLDKDYVEELISAIDNAEHMQLKLTQTKNEIMNYIRQAGLLEFEPEN